MGITAKYWRFNAWATWSGATSNYLSLAELSLYDDDHNKINKAAATSVTASNSGGGGTASGGYDDNPSTYWATPRASSSEIAWLQVYYSTPITVNGFGIICRNETATKPSAYNLQYSDDGVTWNNFSGDLYNKSPEFVAGTEYKYFKNCPIWEVSITATKHGTYAGLQEIEFRTVAGISEQPSGGFSIATNQWSASESSVKAFDGNTATDWGQNGLPAKIAYIYNSPIDVKEVMLQARSGSDNSSAPKSFIIRYSDDIGLTWNDAYIGVNDPDWTSLEKRTYAVALPTSPSPASPSPASPSPASPSPASPSPVSPGSPSPASPLSPSPASPSEPSPGDNEARITQVPILTVDVNPQPSRITQVAIMVPYSEYQPTRVTQVPILSIYEPKPVPLPKVIIPEIPVNESWIWKTTISTAINGKEQRARLREYPRFRISINALIFNENERRDIYAMMMRFVKQTFIYPLFHYNTYLTAASSVGSSKLYCDTSRTDLRAGEQLALFDPYLETIDYLTIDKVDVDGVNLTTPLDKSIPTNWQICPAIAFRTSPGNGINMNNIAGKFELVMESVLPRTFVRPTALPPILTKDGIMIIPNRHLSDGGIPETFNMGMEWVDNDTAIPVPFLDWKQARLSGARKYRFDRHTESDYWRKVIDNMKGRQSIALFPTFRNDIDLRDAVTVGDTIINTNNIEMLNYWQVPNYRYVRIETAIGVAYNKILEVLPVYDDNGYPYYSRVKFQDAITDVNIKAISFMNMCRLDNDSIDLVHYSQYSEISFSIMAVDA